MGLRPSGMFSGGIFTMGHSWDHVIFAKQYVSECPISVRESKPGICCFGVPKSSASVRLSGWPNQCGCARRRRGSKKNGTSEFLWQDQFFMISSSTKIWFHLPQFLRTSCFTFAEASTRAHSLEGWYLDRGLPHPNGPIEGQLGGGPLQAGAGLVYHPWALLGLLFLRQAEGFQLCYRGMTCGDLMFCQLKDARIAEPRMFHTFGQRHVF